jgi:hypothetical protein
MPVMGEPPRDGPIVITNRDLYNASQRQNETLIRIETEIVTMRQMWIPLTVGLVGLVLGIVIEGFLR